LFVLVFGLLFVDLFVFFVVLFDVVLVDVFFEVAKTSLFHERITKVGKMNNIQNITLRIIFFIR